VEGRDYLAFVFARPIGQDRQGLVDVGLAQNQLLVLGRDEAPACK